jgi:multicomponent K+:H+ antiporter subunit A
MLSLLVAFPFVASAFAAVLPTHARNLASIWAASTALVGLALTAIPFPEVQTNAVLRQSFAWLDIAGASFMIRVDGFAWLFAMLIYAIGLLVVVYSR